MIKRFYFLLIFILAGLCPKAQFDTSFAKKNIRLCIDSLVYGFKTNKPRTCLAWYMLETGMGINVASNDTQSL